jgi:hypothetical protein
VGGGEAGGGRRRPGVGHCASGRAPEGRAEGQGRREEEGGKNEAEDHFANPKKNRDFTVKSL